MNMKDFYEEYHRRNPIARYVRRNLPDGFISRPLMIAALVFMLFSAWYLVEQSDPYFECYLPCEHPITGEYLPIPMEGSRWYSEGTPLAAQYTHILTVLGLQFTGFMMLNFAYWGIRTKGGRQ